MGRGVSACECKALTPFANVNDMANTEVDNVNEVMNQNVREKKRDKHPQKGSYLLVCNHVMYIRKLRQ